MLLLSYFPCCMHHASRRTTSHNFLSLCLRVCCSTLQTWKACAFRAVWWCVWVLMYVGFTCGINVKETLSFRLRFLIKALLKKAVMERARRSFDIDEIESKEPADELLRAEQANNPPAQTTNSPLRMARVVSATGQHS